MKTIDLSGEWLYNIHPQSVYENEPSPSGVFADEWRSGYKLPGSACENGLGKRQEYYDELTKEAVRAPREKYEYIGRLYVRRKIEIPKDWEGKVIRLFLERVNIASELWIDGIKIDNQIIELSAPHVYNLTDRITPGTHTITICIDNRNLVNMDIMASGYSIDTQGYWNGIIGRMELQCEEKPHLENIQVYPDEKGINIRAICVSENYSPMDQTQAIVTINVTDPTGNELGEKKFNKTLWVSRQPNYFRYDIENPKKWNEFNPSLYTVTVKYECSGVTDIKTVRFGMRVIKREGKKLILNDRQLALRGTIDCAQFPLTGYPDTDKKSWLRKFSIIKEYGLNHVRFHAWCPPEAAFEAADEVGIYLSIEMPLWLNRDVCAIEVGDDPAHYDYYPKEAITISDTYGNHPSFIMFSNGNENLGAFDLLERIIITTKAYDPRRVYTITTNFDHEVLPCEDYFCAYDANLKHIRIQNMHDEAAKDTYLDYRESVEEFDVPIISFEVGQYCTYPDVDICEKYTGNMLPVNFDAIRKDMKKHKVYDRLADYIKASGDMQIKLYKEDLEAAFRTKDFGGIELLSLTDYTGQSTATVGILDVFHNSKGIITPEEWRGFCNSVVPLFKAKRIFKNTENLEAELDLYNFGKNVILDPVFEIKIYNGSELFWHNHQRENKLSIPLGEINKSSMLKIEITVEGHKNIWRVFVFAETETPALRIIRTQAELDKIVANGGKAVVGAELFKDAKEGSFIPVFWSPVHFPTPKPLGSIIDINHPIFKVFPTEKYQDYQWKTLMEHSVNMQLPDGAKPLVEIVPNFVDNTICSPLFEIKVGAAELLYCGFDLNVDDITVKSLKNAIYNYMK
ncbi:MAG: hypothetical protein J1G06_06605 [Oscillospiraceae bacterium]|nr:hypothetical protein [Oscillospiraceae bacterium]